MLLFITGAFFSCKKYNDNIVVQGQNGSTFTALVNDTLAVDGYTINEDSLIGSNLSYYLLGACQDEIFGAYSNNLLCKLTLNEPIDNFPSGVGADSAILFLPFIQGLNFYGNQLTQQHIVVKELDETLDANTFYYQGWNYKTKNTLGQYFGSMYFTENRTIKNNNTDLLLPPGLYIKLDPAFANRLTSMPTSAFATDENLAAQIKGIALEAIPFDMPNASGGFGVFDLSNENGIASKAKIIVYYNDTSSFLFSIANEKTSVNVGKSYGYKPAVQQQISNPSNSNLVYAQGGNSVKVKVSVKDLNTLAPGKKVIVNKSSITFFLADNTTDYFFSAPKRINLLLPQAFSVKSNITKDQLDPSGASLLSIGGTLNSDGKSYTFTTTRQIQHWINQYADNLAVNPAFTLSIPSDNPITGSRAVFDLSKTKVNIIYTLAN